MLATSWPWPYAPEGVPVLTKPMIRADPGDHFDGVGWDSLGFTDQASVENQYMMWGRAEVFAERAVDSGIGDNGNQILHSRIADRSEEHTSELQSLMRSSYAVFFLKKKK